MAVHPMPTPARQPEPEPEPLELHRGGLRSDRAPVIGEPDQVLNKTYLPQQLEGSSDDALIIGLATSMDLHNLWSTLAERTRAIASDARLSLSAQIDDSQKLAAEQLVRANSKASKALGQLEQRRAELQAELQAPPKGADPAAAAEIRSVLRGMTEAQRSTHLRQAIEQGDALLVSAIYGAHPVLTRINPEMRAMLADAAGRVMHPEAAETLAAVERAIEHVSRLRDSWHRRAREVFAVRLAPRRQWHEAVEPDLIQPEPEPEPEESPAA